MPPKPTKNFYVPPNIKKKPPATSDVSPASSPDQDEKGRRGLARGEDNRQERLELEDGDQELETYSEDDPEIEDREEEGRELDEEDVHEEEHHDGGKERRETDDFQVCVGQLGCRVTEEDLREAFSPMGDIVAVRLIRHRKRNRNKGFAFIRFATVEQASRALREVPHPLIKGMPCRVGPSYNNRTLSVGKTSSHPESREMVGSRRRRRSILDDGGYDADLRRSRERDRARHRSEHSSPEKSYSRRSPASPYGRSYRDAYHGNPPRSSSLAARRGSHRYDDDDYRYDSHGYRDAYLRYRDDYRGSGSYRDAYCGNPPRSSSLAAAHRVSHRYDDDDYRYDSHGYRDAYLRYRDDYRGSGSYKDAYCGNPLRSLSSTAAHRVSQRYDDDYSYGSQGRDYTSISGSKRSHSAVEEVGPPYAESPTKRSRTHYDYGGSSSRAPYADSSHVQGDHSSAGYSQRIYNTRTSGEGYMRDEVRRGDEERMRRSSYDRDRVPSRGDLRAASSSRDHHSRGKDDSRQ